MTDELIALAKKLNVPLLTADEKATLTRLNKEWNRWRQHELEHAPLKVAEHQKAAYAAFLDNPTPENEQRLMVIADANLTGTRYGVLRRACAELRARICGQAGAIVKRVAGRLQDELEAEHARRLEQAAPLKWEKKSEPGVVEARKALDEAFSWNSRLIRPNADHSPLMLADWLMEEAGQ